MPSYTPYMGLSYWARKRSKRDHIPLDLEDLMFDVSITMAGRGAETDAFTCLFELAHYSLSHHVVQVSSELAIALMETEMPLDLRHVRLPFSAFEIAPDGRTIIPGTNLMMPGILVFSGGDQAMNSVFDRYSLEMSKRIRRNPLAYGMRRDMQLGKRDDILAVRFIDPFVPFVDGSPIHNANVNTRLDAGKPVDKVIDDLGTISNVDEPLNDRDKQVHKQVLRLVMGIACYLNLADPDVAAVKTYGRPKIGRHPDAILIGGNFSRSPGWHIRKAHFRVLRDERFARAKDGSFKVTWVRQTEVGGGRLAAGENVKIDMLPRSETERK